MSGSSLTSRSTAGAGMPATYVTASGMPRYNPVSQALHWLTALLALAILPLAWVAISLPNGEAKGTFFVLHKSVGFTIFAIVVIRIVWRMIHPAPADPAAPRALEVIARINHWLLYAVFLLMPVSGYLLSAFAGRSTPYFWLFTIPGFEKNEPVSKAFEAAHVAGQFAVYLLVALHVAGTVWHLVVRRDGLLERMLPVQDGRGSR
jgi:cytochrome b561